MNICFSVFVSVLYVLLGPFKQGATYSEIPNQFVDIAALPIERMGKSPPRWARAPPGSFGAMYSPATRARLREQTALKAENQRLTIAMRDQQAQIDELKKLMQAPPADGGKEQRAALQLLARAAGEQSDALQMLAGRWQLIDLYVSCLRVLGRVGCTHWFG